MAVIPRIADQPALARLRPARYIKRILPRTLLGRSLLIIFLPLILLQVITTYAFYQSNWNLVIRRLSSGLAGDVAMAVDTAVQYPGEAERARLVHLARLNMELRLSFTPVKILSN